MMANPTNRAPTMPVADPEGSGPSPLWRMVRIVGLGLLGTMLLGAVFGFIGAHVHEGGDIDAKFVLILGAILSLLAGCGWLLRRQFTSAPQQEPLTAKERLNRNLLIASGAIGGIIGLALAIAGGFDEPRFALLSREPLPSWLAVVLIIAIGVLMPVIGYCWHRYAVDEQEADAYKSGALAALYLYMIGAPVWWFAWRGGFAPEPNGVIIYLATVTVVGIVWLGKKYR